MRLLVLLWLVSLALAQNSKCDPVRVRKPWSLLTAAEKKTYVEAVGKAMASGYHHQFVEIHTEPSSEAEAHGCMFIYWHRKFLLAYENMLRSLDPAYECLTIPYWDYATLSSSYVSGSCSSIYSCDSGIINAFGGNINGNVRRSWDSVNGDKISASACVANNPLNNFCQSSSAYQNKRCMGCVPRNDFSRARVPAEANIASVFNQVLGGSNSRTGKTLDEATRGIQQGCHNTIHANIGATMGTFESPADPLFYLHHAQVDLLHRIYFKCNVADAKRGVKPVLSKTQKTKSSDAKIWTNCARYDGSGINPTDPVRMIVGEKGGKKWNVNDPNSPLNKFFKDLPLSYSDYIDGDDLGSFSYQYQYTGMLADMLTKCKSFVVPRRASLMEGEAEESYPINPNYIDRCVERPRLACEILQTSFIDYLSGAAGYYGWSQDTLAEQLDALLCVHHEECLGGCSDYSAEFKANFHPKGPPRCKVIMDKLKNRELFIELPNWRKVMANFFPCGDEQALLDEE